MKPEDLAKLTPEQKRIRIAELCGWKRGQVEDYSFADPSKERFRESWIDPRGIDFRKLPDYLNDLNAMHEAEKVLTEKQQRDYAPAIGLVAGRGYVFPCYEQGGFNLLHATAAQRADAFLLTLG